MSNDLELLVKAYGQQTKNILSRLSPGLLTKHDTGIDYSNRPALLYADGGLFSDCDLEASVMNLSLTPARSLLSILPVQSTVLTNPRYAYLTALGDTATGALPETACEVGPSPADLETCYCTMDIGRYSFSSRTIELDELIRKAHRGVHDDFFVPGNIRGVSAPILPSALDNITFLEQGALAREMRMVGRLMQNQLVRDLWTGDPANAATNTAGGGRKQIIGLDLQIADDYDTNPNVTGAGDCSKLNSDIKDFGDECIGGGGASILYYLEELEDTLSNRAVLMGYSNVTSVVVMHPQTWSSIVRYLPNEMMSNYSVPVGTDAATGATLSQTVINVNDRGAVSIRQELRRSQAIELNGRVYPVILDDGIPVEELAAPPAGATGPAYRANIYFVPLNVDGENVLTIEHMDYTQFAGMLSMLPSDVARSIGWTDGGRYHWTHQRDLRCLLVDVKIEPRLKLLAPFLAGKIENVVACKLQDKDFAFAPTVV